MNPHRERIDARSGETGTGSIRRTRAVPKASPNLEGMTSPIPSSRTCSGHSAFLREYREAMARTAYRLRSGPPKPPPLVPVPAPRPIAPPVKRERVKAPNWTKEEDALLLDLRARNKTMGVIARFIRGRSEAAVISRLRYLDPALAAKRKGVK